MSASLLRPSSASVAAVCFSCGVEKTAVFGRCDGCGVRPRQEDELLDSLVLSRYASSETVLARAVAERSPGEVLKAATRSTMREAQNALREPQLRMLLGLVETTQKLDSAAVSEPEQWVEQLQRGAERAMPPAKANRLDACLQHSNDDALWIANERLLQALRAQADSVTVEQWVEALLDLAQRCHVCEPSELRAALVHLAAGQTAPDSSVCRQVWALYQQSLVDRVVVALERVPTADLIRVFVQLQVATEKRRDKQALPLIRALMAVYKQHALDTLRREGDNAARLISAIRTNDASEGKLSAALVAALEAMVANWRTLAQPLGGVIADREVSSIRRKLSDGLQDAAEHLSNSCRAEALSTRTAKLALELM